MGRRLHGQALLPAVENCRVSVLEPRGLGDRPCLMGEGGGRGERRSTQGPRAGGSSSGKPRGSPEKGRRVRLILWSG